MGRCNLWGHGLHQLISAECGSLAAAMNSPAYSACVHATPTLDAPMRSAGNKDKKLAALDIVNLSIKIYFRLNTLRLCKNLMRTVDSRQFAAFEAFPTAQRVTYKFYVGRLAVFDENYVSGGDRGQQPYCTCDCAAPARGCPSHCRGPEGRRVFSPTIVHTHPLLTAYFQPCEPQQEARMSLEYALQHCHTASQHNKALVLKYLVPVSTTVLRRCQCKRHVMLGHCGQYSQGCGKWARRPALRYRPFQ